MKKPNVAVIYFPGNNCEQETLKAILASGMDSKIVRYNKIDEIEKFDGFVIPGGWAYEDRIRAGVISSKERVFGAIKKESSRGKPVLGICNGAQALIETGIVPGLKDKVEMALAPNINPLVSGYYCAWVNIKNVQTKNQCVFTNNLENNQIIPIPIAHGEGRFVTKDEDLIKELYKNNQVIFKYCTEKGKIENRFPINPNGAVDNIAAVSNKAGNVMAIMPHSERCAFVRQLPDSSELKNSAVGHYGLMESFGPGMKVFESMKDYIERELSK
jgi:phosphoribosylformylglycinamidine synthase subunit PurQ / glutaminase